MADTTPVVDSVTQEVTTPVRIGAGSFATVFASPGRSIVIKVAHLVDSTSQVEKEFNSLHSVYTLCNSDSIFAIPRALAFYDPLTKNILFFPPAPGRGRRRDPRRPFEPDFFANLPPQACYVMDRAAPLPPGIAELVRSKFYSERAMASGAVAPLMCRLYFGKELRPSAFVNPNNFPIDVARYDVLYKERQNALLPKEEVAAGMGEMLSRIQWIAGYDARDIEFVMAGSPDAGTVRLYVIDFNQVRFSMVYFLSIPPLKLSHRCVHSTSTMAMFQSSPTHSFPTIRTIHVQRRTTRCTASSRTRTSIPVPRSFEHAPLVSCKSSRLVRRLEVPRSSPLVCRCSL